MSVNATALTNSVSKQHELFQESLTMSGNLNTSQPKEDFNFILQPIETLNQSQVKATNSMARVLAGDSDYAHQAMIDAEIASYNMSFAVKVREKTIQTINQLMNTQM